MAATPGRSNPAANESSGAPAAQVFRQPGSVYTGWGFIVLLALMAVIFVINDPGYAVVPLAWALAASLVVWVVLIRPAMLLGPAGISMRNLIRDVTIPWSQLEHLEQRWNLRVFAKDDTKYTSWAISSQRPQRRRSAGAGGLFGGVVLADRDEPDEPAAGIDRENSAAAVATLIWDTKEEYDGYVAAGELDPGTAPVSLTMSRPALIALAVAVVAAVIGLVAR